MSDWTDIPAPQSYLSHPPAGAGGGESYQCAPQPARAVGRLWLHIGLFLATIASTLFVGYLMSGDLTEAAGYSAAIMGILLLHEMGHFVMCMRYHVPATLPYFIPIPLPPFGTMGAVIRMRGQLRSRRSIFDIGAAGPVAGLALAIPVAFWGLRLSQIVEPGDPSLEGGFRLGDSILFWLISKAAMGAVPTGHEVLLHPIGLAGWAGLFVTGLNLLPVGQLDGGHIVYALLGRRAKWAGIGFLGLLAALTLFYHRGWWPLIVLLLFMGPRHPPTADPRPLDRRRVLLGMLMIMIFIMTFVPQPIVVDAP